MSARQWRRFVETANMETLRKFSQHIRNLVCYEYNGDFSHYDSEGVLGFSPDEERCKITFKNGCRA